MSSKERWLKVYDFGRSDSGEPLVGVVGPGTTASSIVAVRSEDLRDAPPTAAPELPAAAPCAHRFSGYRTETADEILRELVRRLDAGGDIAEVIRVAREHQAEGARYVRRCVDCDALDVYTMARCGHAPWDREHGCYADCHEAA